jgi:hypothetical protein
VVIAAGTTVELKAGGFTPTDNVSHKATTWQVIRADNGEVVYESESETDLVVHKLPDNTLPEGLKYAWRAGFTDTLDRERWSEYAYFTVGISVPDDTVQQDAGVELKDFKMVSIVQWPDDPDAEVVFGPYMDSDYESNYRIGTYNAETGTYTEFGHGLEVQPGYAYWFLARNGFKPEVDGVKVTTAYDIDVKLRYGVNGWNMVAPPNQSDYRWSQVQVVYTDENGNQVAVAISELSADNGVIDLRLWRWEDGQYYDDTDTLKTYEGYWVKVLQPDVSLRFRASVAITANDEPLFMFAGLKHKLQRWLRDLGVFPREAVADSQDAPPMPMGDFNRESGSVLGENGCFIHSAGEMQ